MINLVDSVVLNIAQNGVTTKRCVLLSSTAPSSLTITGSDVEEMKDTDIIAMGSVLITPNKNYIAFEDGQFTEKG